MSCFRELKTVTRRHQTRLKGIIMSTQALGFYVDVFQSMSTTHVYSRLDGDVLAKGESAPPEGFYALSYKPWIVQVAEQDASGAWHVRHYGAPHMRKAQAIAECDRLGVAPNYVSHHSDSVKGMVIAR